MQAASGRQPAVDAPGDHEQRHALRSADSAGLPGLLLPQHAVPERQRSQQQPLRVAGRRSGLSAPSQVAETPTSAPASYEGQHLLRPVMQVSL